ncbi:MAG TPA: T9SS type A sorting domain-containing protein [Cyclobacteriaceae bacterium]|nr:T9SS type A sorting domain-containing protein [Cyclobacteriaceae bacterium]
MKYNLLVLLIFLFFQSAAQKIFQHSTDLQVQMGERNLAMPFAGGINTAQVQTIDLTDDGVEELVIWDKNAAQLLVFEKVGDSFLHKPELSYYFPQDISNFLILADYDGDGRKDIFTGSPFGIKVFRNVSTAASISWEIAQDYLRLDNRSNLQMNTLDVPAIVDLDGDGDLDIVTFNFASGDFLEFFKNTSVERKGMPDVDGFASAITRWGAFEFCGCGNFSFGQTCEGRPIHQASAVENLKVEHAGGHSVLLHDFNGDGLLDMLMGQDECNTLYYLVNEGTNDQPVFTSFSGELPKHGPLPVFPIFHAAFMVEDQLIISSNSPEVSSPNRIDFARSLYRYNGSGELLTTAFLQEDMLDLGENARPFFKRNAQLGELIVTANGILDSKVTGKAYRFVRTAEGFRLVDDDFLNLSSLSLTDLQYLEILTSSNQSFLLVSGVEIINFSPVRKLYASTNLQAQGLQELSLPEVQLRGNDQVEFYRRDGKDYLLLARQSGELIRYEISFNPNPKAALMDRNFLGFTDNPAHRNLSVHVAGSGSKLDLYSVDQRGIVEYIPDFLNNKDHQEVLVRLSDQSTHSTRFGRSTWIASIPSVLSQHNDLLLGSVAGGLVYLKDVSDDSNQPADEALQIKLYPNPSSGVVNILSSSAGSISLINILGQVVLEERSITKEIPLRLDLQHLSSGVYVVRFIDPTGKRLSKKLILRP